MKKISECRVCSCPDLQEILDLGDQPFANALLKDLSDPDLSYPLSVSWCPDCNLVQLNHTADPKELFSSYVWVTGTSKTAQEHSTFFYENVMSRVKNLDGSYVLEAASNDGTFLQPFLKNKHSVLGVDPAENIVKMAVENGVPTRCAFFSSAEAGKIVEESGKAKAVIARNVLAHVANLHDFVKGLSTCLHDDGILAIEVHYAKIICEEVHYDSIYHEHLCYFTLKSIERLLRQHDLFVTDVEESPINGGSLIVYAKKNPGENSPALTALQQFEEKTNINDLQTWETFSENVHHHRDQLQTLVSNATKNGPIVGYGASARSSTLLNFCGIDNQSISMIADQNPLKQKMYTSGTHIPIHSLEDVMKTNPATILILAWNFSKEIMGTLQQQYAYSGEYIVPLPSPQLVQSKK